VALATPGQIAQLEHPQMEKYLQDCFLWLKRLHKIAADEATAICHAENCAGEALDEIRAYASGLFLDEWAREPQIENYS